MPDWVVPLLVVAGIVCWWCFVVTGIAFASGWRTLARHYPAGGYSPDRPQRFRTIRLGWCNYGNCVTVGTGAGGLYLAVFVPFRPGHPPLFIPWAGVASACRARHWYGSWLELRFAAAPEVKLLLPEALGRRVAADANRSWESVADE